MTSAPEDGPRRRPLVRGRYMRTFVESIDELPVADRDAIRSRIAPEDLDAIESSGAVAWLDAGINLRCTQAVYDRLGEARSRRFFRGLLGLVYDTSLFASFIRGVVRLFGRDVGGYCRWIERGFGLAFRDFGHWSVGEATEGRVSMRLRELPAAFVDDRCWLDSVAASLGSLLDLAEVEGTVTIARRVHDGADFELSWRPRR